MTAHAPSIELIGFEEDHALGELFERFGILQDNRASLPEHLRGILRQQHAEVREERHVRQGAKADRALNVWPDGCAAGGSLFSIRSGSAGVVQRTFGSAAEAVAEPWKLAAMGRERIVIDLAKIPSFIAWLVLFCVAAVPCAATGPSTAIVEMTPIAAGEDGVVVFKTMHRINRTGAHTMEGTQFGWLCASAAGLWVERSHLEFHEKPTNAGLQHQEIERFESRADLSDPPPSLVELLQSCGVVSWSPLKPAEGRGRASWQPGQICLDGVCVNRGLSMKSVAGLQASPGSGSKVASQFYYAGVAVFENLEHFEESEPAQQGARFEIVNLFEGRDIGIDYMSIAGIVIFPEFEE